MPSAEELEQLLEDAEDHLDAYEISRLEEMERAKANDPWEVAHGNEGAASGMGE